MKKFSFIITAMIVMATTAYASDFGTLYKQQDSTRKKVSSKTLREEKNRARVSELTKVQFAQDFPEAKNPVYSKSPNFDEVRFISGKKRFTAYYDSESSLVGTTQKKLFSNLPSSAQKYILKNYPGYSIAAVTKFDDNENNVSDMYLYDSEFDGADNYFVDIKKGTREEILQVNLSGDVTLFKRLSN